MPCFHPLPAWRTPGGITLRESLSLEGRESLHLPCGSCLGCRQRRARDWAIRCTLELGDHDRACWSTITYDDDHLPATLSALHLSRFVKRLRERVRGDGRSLRFFACAEYGERTQRPHYHAIWFGLSQCDESVVQASWPHGFVRTDSISPAAISYVAGYATKKIRWRGMREERVDPSTGEVFVYQPPFLQMSRRPGIGASARDRHWRSWRRTVIHDGHEFPVPRFLQEGWKRHASAEQLESFAAESSRLVAAAIADGGADVGRDPLAIGEHLAHDRLAKQSQSRRFL